MKFSTFADAEKAGFTRAKCRAVAAHRGIPIIIGECVDGYERAVTIPSHDGRFDMRNGSQFVSCEGAIGPLPMSMFFERETNAAGRPGCFALMFRPGDLEAAIGMAIELIDE